MKPDPLGMRITFYHLLPCTATLIAVWDGEVVGTISIIRDNPLGLPLESDFDISGLKQRNVTVAEISSLAIKKNHRHRGKVLFPLLKFLWIYCKYHFSIDYMLIATNPKLDDLFEGILLFDKLDQRTVENYGFANGAPAVAKYLNLLTAPLNYLLAYGHKSQLKNLFKYMVIPENGGTHLSNIQLPGKTILQNRKPDSKFRTLTQCLCQKEGTF